MMPSRRPRLIFSVQENMIVCAELSRFMILDMRFSSPTPSMAFHISPASAGTQSSDSTSTRGLPVPVTLTTHLQMQRDIITRKGANTRLMPAISPRFSQMAKRHGEPSSQHGSVSGISLAGQSSSMPWLTISTRSPQEIPAKRSPAASSADNELPIKQKQRAGFPEKTGNQLLHTAVTSRENRSATAPQRLALPTSQLQDMVWHISYPSLKTPNNFPAAPPFFQTTAPASFSLPAVSAVP